MSVIEEALVAILAGNAGVKALAGSRIYPLVAPPDVTLPAIAYQRISGPRVHSHSGSSGLASPRFQFTALASTYSGAKALVNAMRQALDCYVGIVLGVQIHAIVLENEVDGYNDSADRQASTFTVWIDATVWHQE